MNLEIESLKTDLLTGMQSYLDDYDAGYTTKDIQKCGKIVDSYIANMKSLKIQKMKRPYWQKFNQW